MKKNNRPQNEGEKKNEIGVSKSIYMKKRKYQNPKKMSDTSFYNPAAIKKQREFYKNAKYVNKFNKSIKKEAQRIESSPAKFPNESQSNSDAIKRGKKNNNHNRAKFSLGEIYKKKREEQDKERAERDAIIKAKNEERQAKEARRKANKEKMLKKTRHGQPVMRYRIERLLETIQGSQKQQ